nr:MAG TPA: POTRA domain TamA domain 1 [Caudoviricetes sp.]
MIREISDAEFSSPAQYRQRFIIAALKDRGYFNGS